MSTLRETFTEQAGSITDVPFDGATVRHRVSVRRQRRRVAAAAAAVLAVVVGAVVVAKPFQRTVDPVEGEVPVWATWAARGDLKDEPGTTSGATAVWEESSRWHYHVRVLYAATTDAGPAVVLTGVDRDGVRSVALILDPDSDERPLTVVDEYVPPPDAEHIGFLIATPPLAVVVGPPDADRVRFATNRAVFGRGLEDGAGSWLTAERNPIVALLHGGRLLVSERPLARQPVELLGSKPAGGDPPTDQVARMAGVWPARRSHPEFGVGSTAQPKGVASLLDGRYAIAARMVATGGSPDYLVLAVVDERGDFAFYVDRPVDDPAVTWQFSAMVGEQLVVVVEKGVTKVEVFIDGVASGSGAPDNGIAILPVSSGRVTLRVHAGDRVVYDGPPTATEPLP